jgi:hypothetical protein
MLGKVKKTIVSLLLMVMVHTAFAQVEQSAPFALPWKNVIKLEIGGMVPAILTQKVGGFGVDYERSFNKVLSLCLYVGIERPIYGEVDKQSTIAPFDYYYQGVSVSPRVRFYLGNKKNKHPRGTYVNTGLSYSSLQLHMTGSGDGSYYTYPFYSVQKLESHVTRTFFMVGVGHQEIIGRRMTLSAALNGNIKLSDVNVTELPGYSVVYTKGGDISLSFDLAIGYAFGVK